MSKNSKPILIVAGEPLGIFFEIFFKSLKKKRKSPLILIANKELLQKQMKLLKFNIKINTLKNYNNFKEKKLKKNSINLINVHLKFNSLKKIKIKDANLYISKSFKIALELLKKNREFRLINGPIIKKNFLKKKYLGITEYLGDKTNRLSKIVMLIYNKDLSVSPITTHIPIKNVHNYITKEKIINHVKTINNFYKHTKRKKPNIAITGLNPHCESNYDSSEEKRIIIPSIKILKKLGYKVSGPFPADTIFLKKNVKKLDVIVGMYHDQVLTPIKTLFGFKAINITLGLPFIRISPDHGPNLDMFGKNKSNPQSLFEALNFLDR